jgi:hypothetical protein
MRERYVQQVLLVTLGFGVLLGVIAVIDTPADWSQQIPGSALGTRAGAEPRPSKTMAADATPRDADFSDECAFPARIIRDCPQPEPQDACERTSHKKSGTTAE